MTSWLMAALLLLAGCTDGSSPPVPVPGRPGALKTAARERARRRAYDGAPPVIPHDPQQGACLGCHGPEGLSVPGLGFAPPSPHGRQATAGRMRRCRQCHVPRRTETLFVESDFAGLRQDLRHGERLDPYAPPVIPHQVLMRENCRACHTGAAAREEIRTSHPERVRCRQCHVQAVTRSLFERPS